MLLMLHCLKMKNNIKLYYKSNNFVVLHPHKLVIITTPYIMNLVQLKNNLEILPLVFIFSRYTTKYQE